MNDNKISSIIDNNFTINTDDLNDLTLTADLTEGYLIYDDTLGSAWSITASYVPATTLHLGGQDNKSVTIDFSSGDVKIAEGMTVDEAAKLFWDRVMEHNPLRNIPVPSYVTLISDEPVETPKSPEQLALEAYVRAMKVVK